MNKTKHEEWAKNTKIAKEFTQIMFANINHDVPIGVYWQGIADFLVITNQVRYKDSKKSFTYYLKFLERHRQFMLKLENTNE